MKMKMEMLPVCAVLCALLPARLVQGQTPPTPALSSCQADANAFLSMTDQQLFDMQDSDNRIGDYCYNRQISSSSAVCNYYVLAVPSATHSGWPRTTPADAGTGCVYEGEGGPTRCFFQDFSYDLTGAERSSMCTQDVLANAAAQLRHAITNGACCDATQEPTPDPTPAPTMVSTTLDPTPAPTPVPTTPAPTPAPSCQADADAFLSMTDQELFDMQDSDNRIGEYCYNRQISSSSAACNYYVLAVPSDTHSGWPRTTPADAGTGCVYEGDGGPTRCFFQDFSYDLTGAERSSMCTQDVVANAAAQLRHAITNGACCEATQEPTVVPTQTPVPTLVPTPTPVPTLVPTPPPTKEINCPSLGWPGRCSAFTDRASCNCWTSSSFACSWSGNSCGTGGGGGGPTPTPPPLATRPPTYAPTPGTPPPAGEVNCAALGWPGSCGAFTDAASCNCWTKSAFACSWSGSSCGTGGGGGGPTPTPPPLATRPPTYAPTPGTPPPVTSPEVDCTRLGWGGSCGGYTSEGECECWASSSFACGWSIADQQCH